MALKRRNNSIVESYTPFPLCLLVVSSNTEGKEAITFTLYFLYISIKCEYFSSSKTVKEVLTTKVFPPLKSFSKKSKKLSFISGVPPVNSIVCIFIDKILSIILRAVFLFIFFTPLGLAPTWQCLQLRLHKSPILI